ncbi:Flp pilus assembly protein CpaB [Microvirga makkahensis]|uniref:Flp pilus assembly protein CpaB n=1 Tax=Microvirga makkahensis TaxID=1128670 RepID=A0A7X3MP84_9HYPH|nr:Flp pilus assembly protein CpaB [Microvirga makkahensis]MXQ10691.1 Flp pilus assembly protein CpaB [Microvirga makkahensis]
MLRIFILVGALGAGILAAWLALSLQSGASPSVASVQPVKAPTVQVLVATAELAQGGKLVKAHLRWQPWPEEAINPGFITQSAKPNAVEELDGAIVRTRIVSGEPIREDKLLQDGSNLLAASLSPGMRAVAIRVSPESSAGGFILPNSRVDVIHIANQQGQPEGQIKLVGETILRNIRVLAIDQKVDDAKGEASVIGKTATLELDADQAEIIAGAQASGILSLSLRSLEDGDEVPASPTVKSQATSTIRFFRAGRSETVTIR